MARKKKAKKGRKKGRKRAHKTRKHPKWSAAKRASFKREKRALIAKYNRK